MASGEASHRLASDLLRIPYIISRRFLDELVRDGEPAVVDFLQAHADLIERAWYAEGNASLVAFASLSLSSQLEGRVPNCRPLAQLFVLEAQALLAAATHPEQIRRAFDRAEQAQEILSRLDPSTYSFELLSESILIAGVALKAIGQLDDSIEYLRAQRRERGLTNTAAVALARQEVMMFQDENRHLLLLHDAHEYRTSRPREYFRTLKRAIELLLNRRRIALADSTVQS